MYKSHLENEIWWQQLVFVLRRVVRILIRFSYHFLKPVSISSYVSHTVNETSSLTRPIKTIVHEL